MYRVSRYDLDFRRSLFRVIWRDGNDKKELLFTNLMLYIRMHRKVRHFFWITGIGICAAIFITAVGMVIAQKISIQKIFPLSRIDAKEQSRLADNIVSRCRDESSRPTCYDREIPRLMDTISMEDAFAVTRIVQDRDRSYSFCHVLGHELSAREVKKNPDEWKTVIARCPSGMCSNGCIHGGLQEKFRSESLTDSQARALIPDLQTLCEEKQNWKPTGLERGTCYHALGHLAMYMTGGDVEKSAALCDDITTDGPGRDFHHVCLDGVFMQIFQPLEPEDFALVKGKQPSADTRNIFCDRFSGEQRGSCISESWPLFAEQVKKPEGLVAFCGKEEKDEEDRCYSGMFYILTVQFQFNTDAMQAFCAGLPVSRRGQCAAGVASRLIETDYRNVAKSVQFCADASRYDPSDRCFADMTSAAAFNFHPGSKDFLDLCGRLPEKWKNVCLDSGRRQAP